MCASYITASTLNDYTVQCLSNNTHFALHIHRRMNGDKPEVELSWSPDAVLQGSPVPYGSVSVTVLSGTSLAWEEILDVFSQAHYRLSFYHPFSMTFMLSDDDWRRADFLLVARAMHKMGGVCNVFPLDRLRAEVATANIYPQDRDYMLWLVSRANTLDPSYAPHMAPAVHTTNVIAVS